MNRLGRIAAVGASALLAMTLGIGAAQAEAGDLETGSATDPGVSDGIQIGGWTEGVRPLLKAGTVNHRGAAEEKVINGTTNKRSHGWTTWTGVYHYTNAQLDKAWPSSGVLTTSGRKWGTNGTEAVTSWKPFCTTVYCTSPGTARTFYGK